MNGIAQPWNAKVSSVETGVGLPGFAGTYTFTPQQIADFLGKYIFPPAMGPQDELSPFARTLQSGVGAVGQTSQPPVSYLSARAQNPLGGGMAGWTSSIQGIDPRWPAPPPLQPSESEKPGGLLGIYEGYRRLYGDD